LTCAFLSATALSGSAGETKPADNPAEMKVRLKLNVIESCKLLEHYGSLLDRVLALQHSIRACVKSGDERLAQYEQALTEAQADLERTKKRLIVLESEKAKLVERLGLKNAGDGSPEHLEGVNRMLDRILDRLAGIEKRLEKLERRK
jgi:hypothetical protein